MGRQTAFPGIFIDEVGVQKPPYNEEGVVKEFVGRGVTKEMEGMIPSEDMADLSSLLQGFEDQIGPLRDEYKVKYKLQVKAVPDMDLIPDGIPGPSGVTDKIKKRSVSTRARSFVRAKNPFEPEVLEVSEPTLNKALSGGGIGDVFEVNVSVTK